MFTWRLARWGLAWAAVVGCAVAVLPALAAGPPANDGAKAAPDYADIESAPPPLGWSSWNSFMNSIDAGVIEQTARAMSRRA
jgi:hypothetical protein